MSPEQALAKRVVVDHRSDIYSLGVTLYELLTLQPAFTGVDRQELLRQIAFDEPRSPRKLISRIPTELETIVLKAMAKYREERYQTAQQLSDDLRAFLENKPIKARTPTLANRAAKWSRRHQTLVSAVAIAFVLLSAVLTVSMVTVQRAKTQAVAALAETADLLYTTDMTLAYQAFEKGWSNEVQTILDRYRPTERGVDRRGFEWYLLEKLVQPPASFALSGHKGSVNEMAVFPDRERLASVGQDGELRIWNVRKHELLRTIKLGTEPLHSVAVSPNGRHVAAGSTIVHLCDLEDSAPPRKVFQSEHTVESLTFTPDGQSLAAGVRYHEVCRISLDGVILNRVPCASRAESLEFVKGTRSLLVPNRRGLAADSTDIGFVQIWDDVLSTMQAELDTSGEYQNRRGQITIARASPSGQFIATGERYRRQSFIFERTTGRVVAVTPVSRARLTDLSYRRTDRRLPLDTKTDAWSIFMCNRVMMQSRRLTTARSWSQPIRAKLVACVSSNLARWRPAGPMA
jgi:hypothetical protein